MGSEHTLDRCRVVQMLSSLFDDIQQKNVGLFANVINLLYFCDGFNIWMYDDEQSINGNSWDGTRESVLSFGLSEGGNKDFSCIESA